MNRRQFIVAGICFASVPSLIAEAQSVAFWPFLGEPEINLSVQSTPIHGITYQSNGYDSPRPNRIKKTVAQMKARGARHLIDEFVTLANQMTVENCIPFCIDVAYQDIVGKWLSVDSYTLPGAKMTCGEAVDRYNPQSLVITVEPIPFQVPGYPPDFWAAGTTDGRNIKAVCVTADRFTSNPPTAALRRFDDLVAWEIGNSLALFAGYKAPTTGDEVGSKVPGQFNLSLSSSKSEFGV